jgi:adenylate kinase
MRLILLGPPGCGKGTQAELLSHRHGLDHIATGDLLREGMRQGNPVGQRARPYVEAGQLVPDEVVNDLVAEHFRSHRPQRFVLDGYPRTLTQAASFDQLLRRQSLDLTAVVLFRVSDDEIVRRISGRWSCPKPGCRAVYHVTDKPPRVPGLCDNDQTPLVQRPDDRPETVRARLVVYHKDTASLIPHYRAQGLLREVDGVGGVEEVYARVMGVLQPQGCKPC